ncbi:MAG: hypothetical protein LJF06_04115 [Gemmatimonadetes bacterium]|nr:hypothetical protein [Gemmatimonadota bacterium]
MDTAAAVHVTAAPTPTPRLPGNAPGAKTTPAPQLSGNTPGARTAPKIPSHPTVVRKTAADPVDSGPVPHFTRPKHVRGIYVNAWVAGSARRIDDLTALAARTEINTFVMDMKDASGYVSYATQVPMAKEIGADQQVRVHDLPGLLRRLHRDGIYPIARIVVVKDPVLTDARPDLAVHDTTGQVFRDDKGIVWVNPYSHTVWDYEVALARELARMGFPEIQWDYIRFPDIPKEEKEMVVYPGADGRTKAQVIAGFMSYSRKQLAPLGVRVTADVFGVTASATRDVGIGQVWHSFIGCVDVAQPMVYPSHYWKGSFGFETPDAYPYEVVRHALADALRQSAQVPDAGAVRPWLQDFTLGKPAYGAPEVRAQIQATYDSGIKEWFLWNPASNYTESALEPDGGFKTEPTILVDNHVVPVSRRWEFVDSADGQDLAPDSAQKRDTASVADTVADTTAGGDTIGAADATATPGTAGDTITAGDTAIVRDTTTAADTIAPRDTTPAPRATGAPDTTGSSATGRSGRRDGGLLTRPPRSPGASASARAHLRTR